LGQALGRIPTIQAMISSGSRAASACASSSAAEAVEREIPAWQWTSRRTGPLWRARSRPKSSTASAWCSSGATISGAAGGSITSWKRSSSRACGR
jgi:hypothetical protein